MSTEFHEIVKDLRQDVYIKLLKNDSQTLRNFNGKNQSSFLAYLHVQAWEKYLELNEDFNSDWNKVARSHLMELRQ